MEHEAAPLTDAEQLALARLELQLATEAQRPPERPRLRHALGAGLIAAGHAGTIAAPATIRVAVVIAAAMAVLAGLAVLLLPTRSPAGVDGPTSSEASSSTGRWLRKVGGRRSPYPATAGWRGRSRALIGRRTFLRRRSATERA